MSLKGVPSPQYYSTQYSTYRVPRSKQIQGSHRAECTANLAWRLRRGVHSTTSRRLAISCARARLQRGVHSTPHMHACHVPLFYLRGCLDHGSKDPYKAGSSRGPPIGPRENEGSGAQRKTMVQRGSILCWRFGPRRVHSSPAGGVPEPPHPRARSSSGLGRGSNFNKM